MDLHRDFEENLEPKIPEPAKINENDMVLAKYKIKNYLQDLEKINQRCFKENVKSPALAWKEEVKKYLKQILDDIMLVHNIKPEEVDFALCICGSLAKGQATPYSDLDCFIVTKDAETTKKLKPVVDDLYIIFDKIFEQSNQLCMDPIGINPKKFIGDSVTLSNLIANQGVADPDSFYNSVLSADYVFGTTTKYLETFQEELKRTYKKQDSAPLELAKRYYKQATDEFKGPNRKDKINIKKDLFRPLDFILTGLRMEAGIEPQLDGSHLNSATLIQILKREGKVSPEIVALVENIYQKSMKLRFSQHVLAGKEEDDVIIEDQKKDVDEKMEEGNEKSKEQQESEIKEIRILIDQVAILRGIAKKRVELIEKGAQVDRLPVFSIENFLAIDYADKTFKVADMVFDPMPFIEDRAKNSKKQEDQIRYFRLATAWQQRKEFVQKVKALEAIALANNQNLALQFALVALVEFLKNLPLTETQVVRDCDNFTHALIELVQARTAEAIYNYEKCLRQLNETLRIEILPSLPSVNITSIIAVDSYTTLSMDLATKQDLRSQLMTREMLKIKVRRDNESREVGKNPDYTEMIQILTRLRDNNVSKSLNTNVIIHEKLDLVNVVQGINHLETYLTSHSDSIFKRLAHGKHETFRGYIKEMERRLATEGTEAAVAYLFEKYRLSLKSNPDSSGTTILGQALAISLGMKNYQNFTVYKMYKEITKKISYSSDLTKTMDDYVADERKSFSYGISRKSVKKEIDESLKSVEKASNALGSIKPGINQPIQDFDFPKGAWKEINKNLMRKAQMRGLLELEIGNCMNKLSDNYSKQHGTELTAIPNIERAIHSIGDLVDIVKASGIPNEDLPLLIKALKLAAEITATVNPSAPDVQLKRDALNALLPKIKNNFYLHGFVRHFKVISDDQHPKEKLLKKLQKKIDTWHPWYGAKKEALEKLRDEIKAVDDNRSFTEILDISWGAQTTNYDNQNITNKALMHKSRWKLFSKKDGELTETEEFLDGLKQKYGDVKFKKRN